MSIVCLSHVMRHAEATLGARLVLFVLAEHAHDDGTEAYPAIDTICERTRMSRRGVQCALRKLEADGEIVRDGVGSRGQTKWFVEMGGADSAPRAESVVGGRSSRPGGGAAASPEPTPEPSIEPERLRASALSLAEPPTWSFSGRSVPTAQRGTALAVLAAFNQRAGTDFAAFGARGPSEHLKRITGAVLDHPKATMDDWRKLIDWTLTNPWWQDGAPTVGVVFGPKVIDDNIERCRRNAPPARRNGNGAANGDLIRDLLKAGGEL